MNDMKSKYDGHTPGKWKVLGYSIVKRSRRHIIADTYMQSGNSASLGVQVTKANALLIADAPELLRQRDKLLGLVQRAMLNTRNSAIIMGRLGHSDNYKETAWWKDAEAALALVKEGGI